MEHPFDRLARSVGALSRRALLAQLLVLLAMRWELGKALAQSWPSSPGSPCRSDADCLTSPYARFSGDQPICGASSICCTPALQSCRFDGDCCEGLRCSRQGGVQACRPKGLGDRGMYARCTTDEQCSTGFNPQGDFLKCGTLGRKRVCCAPAGATCNLYGGRGTFTECCDGASCTDQRCHRLAKLDGAVDALPEQAELPQGLALGRLWSNTLDQLPTPSGEILDENLRGLYRSWDWQQGGGVEVLLDGNVEFVLRIDGFDSSSGARAAFDHMVDRAAVSDSDTIALNGSSCGGSFRRYPDDQWHAVRAPRDADPDSKFASWHILANRRSWLIRVEQPSAYDCDDVPLLLGVINDTFARLGLYPDDSDVRQVAPGPASLVHARLGQYRIGARCTHPAQCAISFVDDADILATPTCAPAGPDPSELRCCIEEGSGCRHPSDCCGDLVCSAGKCGPRGLRERPLGFSCSRNEQCTTYRGDLDDVVTCGLFGGTQACCMPEGASCAFERALCCDGSACDHGTCVSHSLDESTVADLVTLIAIPGGWTLVGNGATQLAELAASHANPKDAETRLKGLTWEGGGWVEAESRDGESVHLEISVFGAESQAREARQLLAFDWGQRLRVEPEDLLSCPGGTGLFAGVDVFEDALLAGAGYSMVSSYGRYLLVLRYRSEEQSTPCWAVPTMSYFIEASHRLIGGLR